MEMTTFRPGDEAPAKDRYQVIDRFGEMLNVEVWCEAGQRLPIIGVAGFNPVSYIRTPEATVSSKSTVA